MSVSQQIPPLPRKKVCTMPSRRIGSYKGLAVALQTRIKALSTAQVQAVFQPRHWSFLFQPGQERLQTNQKVSYKSVAQLGSWVSFPISPLAAFAASTLPRAGGRAPSWPGSQTVGKVSKMPVNGCGVHCLASKDTVITQLPRAAADCCVHIGQRQLIYVTLLVSLLTRDVHLSCLQKV